MKRIIFFIIAALIVGSAWAQAYHYSDTTYINYEQFNFDQWILGDSAIGGKVLGGPNPIGHSLSNADLLQYNYTSDPNGVTVVGLSAVMSLDLENICTPMRPPQSLLLYEATPDTLMLIGQLQWEESDYTRMPYFHWLTAYSDSCGGPHRVISNESDVNWIRNFEYFFDKPLIVFDSYYVGGTFHFSRTDYEFPCFYASYYRSFQSSYHAQDTVCAMPPILWKILDLSSYPPHDLVWENYESRQFLMVLPIIRIIDSGNICPPVSGLFMRNNYTDTVSFQWANDTDTYSQYVISYGPAPFLPEEGTFDTILSNRWSFSDTNFLDVPMELYIRRICYDYDSVRQSSWNPPLHFQIHHIPTDTTSNPDTNTHQPEGITLPEEGNSLDQYVRFMPNPASNVVFVASSLHIEHIEFYNVKGEKVTDFSPNGTIFQLDVSPWNKGTYVALIHTSSGIVTKRLVVQ